MDNCNMTFTTKFLITTLVTTSLTSCNTSNVSNEQADTTKSATTTKSIPASTGVVHISSDQLQTLIDKKVTLIDIRRPEEWTQTGVVESSKKITFFSASGAINPNLVTELKKAAPADKPVVLICRTGSRTRVGAQMIQAQLGYKTVYNVEHGITKWIAEGRKTVK